METKKTLKIGTSDFKRIVGQNHYFVDKTSLIYEFFTSSSYISLMPRPKRFGKTLNLSMIEYFFDISKKENAHLFSELEIANHKEFCGQHQNKYPVINITLKDIKETTWENCLASIKKTVADLYKNYRFLMVSEKMQRDDKILFEKIILEEATETHYKSSLKDLCRYLKQHYEKEVIILVDEYDAPIICSYKNTPKPIKGSRGETTYYENVINFMQTFLGGAFKGNDHLEKGLITGVMRVGRESIFSEWNNFNVYGISSAYYADKFGFTKDETEKILDYYGLHDRIKDVDKWYNGYQFGDVDKIYNPWSIVNYIGNIKDGFKPYWVNTSDDSLIKERLKEPNVKEQIQDLIAGKTLEKSIRENFVFPDFETKTELLWTLLFYCGFLTKVREVSLNRFELKIPNYELRFVFTDLILDWIETEYKYNRDLLIDTSNHLISNNIIDFEIGFKKIIGDSISYFDVSTKKGDQNASQEQIYHVYTLGLLAILSDDYIIQSNRESGEGRYDIILIPRNSKNNGVVIELKRINGQAENEEYESFKDRVNSEIENALQQIERKKYYKELLSHQLELSRIIRVPIVFAGKEPYITKMTDGTI